MKISRQNILKKLMKEKIPIRNARRQRTNVIVCSGQWERTRLGGICDMEIGYQVDSMREFGCGNLFGFVSSVFIP